MRHILLSCIILLLALAFCLFSMLHIREICKQTLCALTSAQEQAQIYNFEACRASMQQALRISDSTAFFLLGELIEYDDTQKLFYQPKQKRTEDYITGRFG